MLIHILILIFGAVVLIAGIAFVVLDVMDKVASIKDRAPWVEKILRRRDAFAVLLLVDFVLLAGLGYEMYEKEMPGVEPLKAAFTSADPGARNAEIESLKAQVKLLQREKGKITVRAVTENGEKVLAPQVKAYNIASRLQRQGSPMMEYVLTTNTLRTIDLIGECESPLVGGALQLLTEQGGYVIQAYPPQLISDKRIKIAAQSPVWSPTVLLWISLYFQEGQNHLPVCTFAPQ